MRIAYCITELEPGGAERALVELVTRLDRERFEPAVYVLAERPQPPRDGLARKLEAAGIPVKFLGARHARLFPSAVRRLAGEFRRQQPDVVHSYLFHANLVARFAARRAGVRRVICGIRVAERQARWHLWLDRLTQRRVNTYVCVSQAVADFSQDVAGLPAEKLVVIPNGIDVDALTARPRRTVAELGLPTDCRLLVCVGRLDYQKGVDRLLEIASAMLAEHRGYHLVFVGDGPLRDELERVAAQPRFGGRVHLLGWRDDALDFLAAAEVLLLPSRWEGMPNVVLEAMALARPVVATDVEGVRELLAPFDAQQVVPRDSMSAFKSLVDALLSDPELLSRLGQANQQRARSDFSLQRVVALHEALYARDNRG